MFCELKNWARTEPDSWAFCCRSGSDSMRMSVTTTSAPARARARQSARPRPREPPVTTATLPVRSNMDDSTASWGNLGIIPGRERPLRGAQLSALPLRGRADDWAAPRDRGSAQPLARLAGHRVAALRGGALAEDVAGDAQPLDLGGAPPGLVELCVAHEALHRVLLDVAVA